MLIAIPSTNGIVEGPGEGDEVLIFDSELDYRLMESYHNPGLDVLSARGIAMLVSALRMKVATIIVAHLGSPAYQFIKGKAKLYYADGMKVRDAIARLKDGLLTEVVEDKKGQPES